VAGPTGSGKTTTLYSAIREINILERNVLTVEDPVEYKLSMIKQTQVSVKTGYDFARAGKSFMRQDPDAMLIGEIRDEETAKMAIRASITGHLVLSTIHTNDAPTAIPRLLDLEVDRFLLSSALLAIIAQRLVRKVCPHCRQEHVYGKEHLEAMGFEGFEGSDDKQKPTFKGKGCNACNQTGYLGRTVIGEILIVNDEIKELIYSGGSVHSIREAAVRHGMKTMRENGIRKVLEGVITFEEVLRVVGQCRTSPTKP
jgi:type II secretory ATPase GspE/PulE/Tfp pilus assembly ATPase PilB-like protein